MFRTKGGRAMKQRQNIDTIRKLRDFLISCL